ncbi:hypothetical protein V8G54_019696 [Vigna mungo]|uniref:Uncharacterized protein n=1 Tax=Vigna mungo TaxID=3915 RepID=A0AAQ3NB14_VIGMU
MTHDDKEFKWQTKFEGAREVLFGYRILSFNILNIFNERLYEVCTTFAYCMKVIKVILGCRMIIWRVQGKRSFSKHWLFSILKIISNIFYFNIFLLYQITNIFILLLFFSSTSSTFVRFFFQV